MADGRMLYLLAEGRLVNLAAGDGHPTEIMDLPFAVQALAVEHIMTHHTTLEPKVYVLPKETDIEIAMIKLQSMGYSIDTLSPEQIAYLTQAH